MQIEEGFRDCKAAHYGLGLLQNKGRRKTDALFCAYWLPWPPFFYGTLVRQEVTDKVIVIC
jgi:hypothetical protein